MGSFTSVINLRAALSSRWRQANYSFSSRSKKLSNWSRIKVSSRLSESKRIFKLGVYFSHFVFSSSSCCYFLDSYFDRKFSRFSAKVPKITRNLVVLSFSLGSSGRPFKFFTISPGCKRFKFLKINGVRLVVGHFIDPNFWLSKFLGKANLVPTTIIKKLIAAERQISFRQFTKYRAGPPAPRPGPSEPVGPAVPVFSNFILTDENRRLGINFKNLNGWLAVFDQEHRASFGLAADDLIKVQRRIFSSIEKICAFFFSYYFRVNPMQFIKIFPKLSSLAFPFLGESGRAYSGLKFSWLKVSHKNACNWFLKEFYMSFRFPIFNFLNRKFQVNYSRKLGIFEAHTPGRLHFENLSNYATLPAVLVSSLFAKRLRNRERVNPVLYSLMRLVLNKRKVLGLVIYRGGRFTKKQRALRNTMKFGRVSFNSYIMPIDYGFSTAILKYSIVSVKIWISTPPPVNFFSFGLELSSNSTYPSLFGNFKSYKHFYLQQYFKFGESSRFIRVGNPGVSFLPNSAIFFRSSANFVSSWNFKYFRAYRQFSKFYLSSKSKYFSKIQKLLFLFGGGDKAFSPLE